MNSGAIAYVAEDEATSEIERFQVREKVIVGDVRNRH